MAELKPLATWSGHRRANVVFIHGLGGHEIETWRASDGSGGFWPHWLAEDVPGTAVFTLPHQSTQTLWRGEAMAWQDSAATMLRELLAEPDLSTGPIVLICHSLGGVLAKALLLKARSETTLDGAEEFLQRVRLVVFLSTPHAGSPIAGWAKRLSFIFRPTDLTVSLAGEDSALRGLNSEYLSLSNQRRGDLAHRVYYESQKTGGILVVPASSANPGLPDMPYPVMIDGANHITVCKPTTRDALIVREITAALKALDPDSNHESGVLTLHQGQQATVPGHGEAVPGLVGEVLTLPRRVGLVARWMLAEWRDQKDLQQNVKSIKRSAEEQIELSKETLKKLSTENAIPIEVLQSILLQMDIHAFGKSKDETVALLTKKAMDYRDLVSRLTDKTEAASETEPLIDQAKQALVSGDFTKANTLLALAEQQDLAAATQHQTAVVDRRRSAAQARAERASLALLRPSRAAYQEAADHFAAAAEMVGPVIPDVAWQYRCDQGKTLLTLGSEFGENSILAKAIDHFKTLLHATDRQANPLRWSSLQVYLGTALSTLGERESGTARLEEAITAYRAALEEYTRERVPLSWARTQNNLGNALRTLGARESGTARLEEAVTAFRAALEESTRDRVPLDWARTQNNLGAALRTLGERESGTARLKEAVTAYRAALEERARDRVPIDWAMTQCNLGNALTRLGEREEGTNSLTEAAIAYRSALEEQPRERIPLSWATSQNNLGHTLRLLGVRASDMARLKEAVTAFEAALEERTRDRVPLNWATTMSNLGASMRAIGELGNDVAWLERAVIAYRAALEERTRKRVPLDWAMTQNNLGNALKALGERESGTARLEEAVSAYSAALEEHTRDRVPLDWAMSLGNQGVALRLLAERTRDADLAAQAVTQLEQALQVFQDANHQPYSTYYADQLALARATLATLRPPQP